MRLIFTKITIALIAIIIQPAWAQSQVSAEDQEPLTEEHLRLILGDSTSLTDLSLPDGQVVTERWYRGTDHESFFGFFHIKVVVSPGNNDELVAQHDWVIRDRGKILQGRLHTTCKKDEYYTMQSLEAILKYGAGDDRDVFRLSLIVEPSAPGDSLPFVIRARKYFRNPKRCPENMMMLFMLAEKVRVLPFNQDEIFICNTFYPFEMEISRNLAVRYADPEDVVPDEKYGRLHRFVSEGGGVHTMYFLVDDNHELIKVTNGESIDIVLTSKQEVVDNWNF